MDSINFTGKDNYPVSADTLDMMQNMTKLAASLALLGGDNYILSGCVDNGVNVTPGTIVINGVPYVFIGGAKSNKITISETKPTLVEEGEEFPEAYTKRVAIFAENGEYEWGKFEKVPTNLDLKTLFQSIKGDSPGTIKMWAGQVAKIPVGYMLCNGDDLLINDYKPLFEIIGVSFGGDGLSNFKLPDLRGRFIVGYDNKAGSDYEKIGNVGGENEVELTTDNLPSHDHTDRDGTSFNKLAARAADVDATNTPGSIDDKTADAEYRVGGMSTPQWTEATIKKVGKNKAHENRPPFFTLAYIIKVTE